MTKEQIIERLEQIQQIIFDEGSRVARHKIDSLINDIKGVSAGSPLSFNAEELALIKTGYPITATVSFRMRTGTGPVEAYDLLQKARGY